MMKVVFYILVLIGLISCGQSQNQTARSGDGSITKKESTSTVQVTAEADPKPGLVETDSFMSMNWNVVSLSNVELYRNVENGMYEEIPHETMSFHLSLPETFEFDHSVIEDRATGGKVGELLPGLIRKENFDLFGSIPEVGTTESGEESSSEIVRKQIENFGGKKTLVVVSKNFFWYPTICYVDLGSEYLVLSFYGTTDTSIGMDFVDKVIGSHQVSK